MTDNREVESILEMAGRHIIEAENSFCRTYAIDDNEHIPRLRRIVESISRTARELDMTESSIDALTASLRAFAEDWYMELWMSELYEDEDAAVVRQEGLEVFRLVWNGGRR